MRLLFVTHKYPPQPGGVGVSAQRVSLGMAEWCEQVHVLHATRELGPGQVSSQVEGNSSVFTMGETDRGAESGQLLEATIRALHQKHDYQAVVGFYAVPTGFAAVFTARLLGLPSLLCLRGNDLDRAVHHAGQVDSLRWALQHASAVAAVSKELAEKARILAGEIKVEFIANSVDSELFSPRPKVEPGHLVFSGELRLKKGSDLLFASLPNLRSQWTLTLAGGFRGRAEAAYRNFCLDYPRLAPRIRTLPYHRDPHALKAMYNSAALVLNPAIWDGMPNSVLEAMACGRPVLSTKVGGLADLIEHQRTGYLLELSELGQLATAIDDALADPGREAIGQAARRHVVERHQPAQEAARFKQLVESLGGIAG